MQKLDSFAQGNPKSDGWTHFYLLTWRRVVSSQTELVMTPLATPKRVRSTASPALKKTSLGTYVFPCLEKAFFVFCCDLILDVCLFEQAAETVRLCVTVSVGHQGGLGIGAVSRTP